MITSVYIAGPMNGIKDCNYPLFQKQTEFLRRLGYSVVSPVELNLEVGVDRGANAASIQVKREAMARDCKAITQECCAMALLPNWRKSGGTVVEVALAKYLDFWFLDAMTGIRCDLEEIL